MGSVVAHRWELSSLCPHKHVHTPTGYAGVGADIYPPHTVQTPENQCVLANTLGLRVPRNNARRPPTAGGTGTTAAPTDVVNPGGVSYGSPTQTKVPGRARTEVVDADDALVLKRALRLRAAAAARGRRARGRGGGGGLGGPAPRAQRRPEAQVRCARRAAARRAA
jgi:hypothetical protein